MVTETNATLTTEIGTTTNVSVTPAFTTSATSNVVITSTPAEATTITTRTIYTQTTGNNNAGGTNKSVIGGIIGGIGGVVVIVLLFVVVICLRRRRRDRELRYAPGKDELENAQARNRNQYVPDPTFQVSHENTLDYVNITKGGECNEQTDPSVGPDGYLKKTPTTLLISSEKSKNKQRKGDSVHATEESSQDIPVYGNEDIVGQAAERQNSVPYDQAPPPPDLEESASYVTGRLGPSPEKVYKKDKKKEQKGYVNLKGHKKGGPVFGVLPRQQNHKKKKNTDKMYVNERAGQQTTKGYDVTSEEYYNTKDSKNTDKHYQNTKAQTQEILTQDDVYENP